MIFNEEKSNFFQQVSNLLSLYKVKSEYLKNCLNFQVNPQEKFLDFLRKHEYILEKELDKILTLLDLSNQNMEDRDFYPIRLTLLDKNFQKLQKINLSKNQLKDLEPIITILDYFPLLPFIDINQNCQFLNLDFDQRNINVLDTFYKNRLYSVQQEQFLDNQSDQDGFPISFWNSFIDICFHWKPSSQKKDLLNEVVNVFLQINKKKLQIHYDQMDTNLLKINQIISLIYQQPDFIEKQEFLKHINKLILNIQKEQFLKLENQQFESPKQKKPDQDSLTFNGSISFKKIQKESLINKINSNFKQKDFSLKDDDKPDIYSSIETAKFSEKQEFFPNYQNQINIQINQNVQNTINNKYHLEKNLSAPKQDPQNKKKDISFENLQKNLFFEKENQQGRNKSIELGSQLSHIINITKNETQKDLYNQIFTNLKQYKYPKIICLQNLIFDEKQISSWQSSIIQQIISQSYSLSIIQDSITKSLDEFQFFSYKQNLQELILNNCGISKLNFLKNSIFLQRLNLNQNNLLDLKDIEQCKNLLELFAQKNKIKDISHIKQLPNIQIADFYSNKIDQIKQFSFFPNIKTIFVCIIDNPIQDNKCLQVFLAQNKHISLKDYKFLKQNSEFINYTQQIKKPKRNLKIENFNCVQSIFDEKHHSSRSAYSNQDKDGTKTSRSPSEMNCKVKKNINKSLSSRDISPLILKMPYKNDQKKDDKKNIYDKVKGSKIFQNLNIPKNTVQKPM